MAYDNLMDEKELDELSGRIDAVVYRNEENGYTVLSVTDGNEEKQTIVGVMPFAAAGEAIIASGEWMEHSSYGRQFHAEFAQMVPPSGKNAIYTYLASGEIKGIGPATASLIINKFGEKALDVIENRPYELTQITGISERKALQMSECYKKQSGVRRLMEFICSFGIRPVLAMRLYKYYGVDALAVLRANPYVLASSHIGGSFSEADHMALEMGLDSLSPNRIRAAVVFELQHNSGNGHCFVPLGQLVTATAQLIDVDEDAVSEEIQALEEAKELVKEQVRDITACYLPELYEAETYTAQRIRQMAGHTFDEEVSVGKLIATLEKENGITYAEQQRQTLTCALKNQLTVITGGPGTGKTTSVRAIVTMFELRGLDVVLAAPTGRAAKRMQELTGRDASTIHRLLEAKYDDAGDRAVFNKNAQDPLEGDVFILDESSMVDITLMAALLKALPPAARLVMVGDADQLPSVGPGKVFQAIISSGAVPTIRLTEIFRQKNDSYIIRNAHMINSGEHPDFSLNKGDCFRMRRTEAAQTVDTVAELFSHRLPDNMHIPVAEIQVLSPTRKGEMGTAALNKRLQEALNPKTKEKKEKPFGDILFRTGDRVMQIRNNYDILWMDGKTAGSGIYNGDTGVVTDIDPVNETVTVNFEGRMAVYGFDSLGELEHAWAVTVHKSQGSEYRAVILVLGSTSRMLMTRSVLYTAVSRAKNLLVLVGDDRLADAMIENDRKDKRYSFLRTRIVGAIG